ncbi:uncharacterized protein LOC144141840 [Haemaphysalis longicornis]
MIAPIYLIALVGLSTSETQTPELTVCPGQEEQLLNISSFTIEGATLGTTLTGKADISFTEQLNDDPRLHIRITRADGTELPCIQPPWPCNLKLCNGATAAEEELNADWDNRCPIEPGKYTARLSFPLPDNILTREYLGDGNLVVTLEVENDGKTVECVSLPVKVDVD